MPEGPEIRRAADRLEKAILRQRLRSVYFAFDRLKSFEAPLAASSVTRIETRGKAMLTHFDCGLAVYSHNQLYGRWYTSKPGQTPRTSRSLRFSVHGSRADILLYSASDIDVLTADQIEKHPFLLKLGPDALSPDVSAAQLAERLDDSRFRRRRLAALLLDQGFAAGLGNYLRSEILHAAALAPSRSPASLSDAERHALAEACLEITRRSYRHAGITNELARAQALKLAGSSFQKRRFAAFAREGLPCYQCNSPILKAEMGRRIYWCPNCQS
jgi:endonuclease VIII